MHAIFITGFLTGAVLIIAIGAQNSFVLRQGIRREHVLPVVLVCALSDALLMSAGIAGLGALIQSMPLLLQVARFGGAAFLFVYGAISVKRAIHPPTLQVGADTSVSLTTALGTCLAFTFLNPHVYLDAVVLVGSLASQYGENGRWQFGAGAISASVVWFTALGYGARLLAPLFKNPNAWRVLDSFIALTMFGLGSSLLVG